MKNLTQASYLILAALALLIPQSVKRKLSRNFPELKESIRVLMANTFVQSEKESLSTRLDLNRLANGIALTNGRKTEKSPILIYTPFAPSKNGIGNYSRLIRRELERETQVGIRVSGQSNFGSLQDGVYSALWDDQSWFRGKRLYMLGNGPEHLDTWKMIHRYPGHVVLHDPRIQDIPVIAGEDERRKEGPWALKVNSHAARLPETVETIIVHSETAKDIVLAQFEVAGRSASPKIHVLSTGHPFPAPNSTPVDKSVESRPVIGTLGFQTASKLPHLTYRLIAEISYQANAMGLICGEISEDLIRLATKLWVKAGNQAGDLKILTDVNDKEFEEVAKSLTIGIQLRAHANGESSGPLALLLSSGKPTVVSELGSFAEMASEAIIFFDNSAKSVPALINRVVGMLRDKVAYESISNSAVKYSSTRGFDAAAREILSLIDP